MRTFGTGRAGTRRAGSSIFNMENIMNTAERGAGTAQHVELKVAGMTCVACERQVQRALAGVPGVSGVRVSRATASASVDVIGVPDKDALVDAVRTAGYDARVAGITSETATEPSASGGRARCGCCGGA